MSKWTPGPWVINGKGTIRTIDAKGRLHDWICSVNWRNREANARLIAAAPEMAELLAEVVKSPHESEDLLDAIAALLARINGETP